MKRLCVFLGSSGGARAVYSEISVALGEEIARRGLELIYGGAACGLMAALADAVLAGGGRVTGVIPRGLEQREIAHERLSELRVVSSMHERKATMYELADAFAVLPGGVGTLDEAFEILSWMHLGLHRKPVGVLDVAGYFEGLLAFLDHATREGFVAAEVRSGIAVADDPAELIEKLERASR